MPLWGAQVILVDDKGQLQPEAFNIRVEELKVKDMQFLHDYPRPTIGVLYEDTKLARHFKSYIVNIRDKACAACMC